MKSRRSTIFGGVVLATVVVAATAGITAASSGEDHTLLRADMLVGVQAPFTGATNAIRGVPGGGAPWVLSKGEIELKASGAVHMKVEGLVIDPAFPNQAVAGINPVASFKVTVSCLSRNIAGAAATVNVSTEQIPADRAGNSEFNGNVALPSPCVAPIVFVANGVAANGAWFASTGG